MHRCRRPLRVERTDEDLAATQFAVEFDPRRPACMDGQLAGEAELVARDATLATVERKPCDRVFRGDRAVLRKFGIRVELSAAEPAVGPQGFQEPIQPGQRERLDRCVYRRTGGQRNLHESLHPFVRKFQFHPLVEHAHCKPCGKLSDRRILQCERTDAGPGIGHLALQRAAPVELTSQVEAWNRESCSKQVQVSICAGFVEPQFHVPHLHEILRDFGHPDPHARRKCGIACESRTKGDRDHHEPVSGPANPIAD